MNTDEVVTAVYACMWPTASRRRKGEARRAPPGDRPQHSHTRSRPLAGRFLEGKAQHRGPLMQTEALTLGTSAGGISTDAL